MEDKPTPRIKSKLWAKLTPEQRGIIYEQMQKRLDDYVFEILKKEEKD